MFFVNAVNHIQYIELSGLVLTVFKNLSSLAKYN